MVKKRTPKKRLSPKKLIPRKFFSLSQDFLIKISEIFVLDLENVGEKETAAYIVFKIKAAVDLYFLHQYLSQLKPNETRDFMDDEKIGGRKLVEQAEQMLKTLEGFPEYIFDLLSLKYLKEELVFLARPNSQPYPRQYCRGMMFDENPEEGCRSMILDKYAMEDIDRIQTEEDWEPEILKYWRDGYFELLRDITSYEKDIPFQLPRLSAKERDRMKKEFRENKIYSSYFERILRVEREKPAHRGVLPVEKERDRIKESIKNIVKNFYHYNPVDPAFTKEQREEQEKNALKDLVSLVLEEIDLLPKPRKKPKPS